MENRSIAVRRYIKRHGIKLSWVAASLGMTEALFRYYLRKGFKRDDLYVQFKQLMKAHAAAVVDDLSEL